MTILLEGEDFMSESLCQKCRHKVTRLIVPIDYEAYGISEEMLEELGNGDDLLLEHHFCVKLNLDLDHIVLECPCSDPDRPGLIDRDLLR